jgi:hypothetical protein
MLREAFGKGCAKLPNRGINRLAVKERSLAHADNTLLSCLDNHHLRLLGIWDEHTIPNERFHLLASYAFGHHTMLSFNYAKVSHESSQDDSLEQQGTHPGLGRGARWYRSIEGFQFLRWPLAFFLLSMILICEISILHKQPTSLQLGGEINELVPSCMSHRRLDVHIAWRMRLTDAMQSQQKKDLLQR